MSTSKLLQVAFLWGVALVASGLLALAGQLWPAPPAPRADLILLLVVLPPIAMALLLLLRWPLPDLPSASWSGASRHRRESINPEQNHE